MNNKGTRPPRGTRAARGIFRTVAVTAAALALVLGSSVAGAAPGDNGKGKGGEQSSSTSQSQGKPTSDTNSPQPPSNADYSGNGANVDGPYDSTRDGSASENGKGDGKANGKPCAGCVGKADNKNPKGQLPGGSDPNAGYECDRNQGIGKGNPAHTSCVEQPPTTTTPPTTTPPTTTPPTTPPSTPPSTSTPPTTSSEQPPGSSPPGTQPPAGGKTSSGLAQTGVNVGMPLGIGLAALLAGAGMLLAAGRRKTQTH